MNKIDKSEVEVLIQVLGTGCPKCKKLAEEAEAVARELGADYTLEKVTQIQRIIDFGVMMTPALVVDGAVQCSGRLPTRDELRVMLGGSPQ